MPNPVVHWEISGKDGKKSQEFYSRLFDWNVDANNPMNYGIVTAGPDGGIGGGIGAAQQGTASSPHRAADVAPMLSATRLNPTGRLNEWRRGMPEQRV